MEQKPPTATIAAANLAQRDGLPFEDTRDSRMQTAASSERSSRAW